MKCRILILLMLLCTVRLHTRAQAIVLSTPSDTIQALSFLAYDAMEQGDVSTSRKLLRELAATYVRHDMTDDEGYLGVLSALIMTDVMCAQYPYSFFTIPYLTRGFDYSAHTSPQGDLSPLMPNGQQPDPQWAEHVYVPTVSPSYFLSSVQYFASERFCHMISRERQELHRQFDGTLMYTLPLKCIFEWRLGNPFAADAAYDCMLMRKGMLLSVDREVTDMAHWLTEGTTRQLYDQMVASRMAGNTEEAEEYERKLLQHVAPWYDITCTMRVEHDEVLRMLQPDEAAVEFMQVQTNEGEMYMGIVARGDSVRMYFLDYSTTDDSFTRLQPQEYYTTPYLYNKVWRPLEQALEGARTIYFSPDGALNAIAIEYAPTPVGLPFSCQENGRRVIRLSSTRELSTLYGTLREDSIPCDSIALYGGLDYAQCQTSPLRDLSFRELPFSATEVQNIEDLCRQHGRAVSTYQGRRGTETSFRQLSGRRYSILHLATHGFYLRPEEAEHNATPLMLQFRSALCMEEKVQLRSGLVFSGADGLMGGHSMPDEDGVLYSREVAAMDLDGCRLVVLSACQSGLGDVTGEGVFGLQRAFKQAGVQSLIVSLRPVDDAMTSRMMTYLYERLLDGALPYDALAYARERMRHEFPGRADVWAAFVSIDGLCQIDNSKGE